MSEIKLNWLYLTWELISQGLIFRHWLNASHIFNQWFIKVFWYLVEDFGLSFLRVISDNNDSLCFYGHQNLFQTALLKTVIQGQDGAYKIVSFPETICLPFYSQRDLPIEVAYHQVIVQVTVFFFLIRGGIERKLKRG